MPWSETDMNLCRLAQSLESDTVLLIFKNMYPHQAHITETPWTLVEYIQETWD